MSKYIPPEFLAHSFSCPYCGCVSSMSWTIMMLYGEKHPKHDGPYTTSSGFVSALCNNTECLKRSVWLVTKLSDVTDDLNARQMLPSNGVMVYPANNTITPPSEDMPADIKKDYLEAASIFTLSPRSSAALLRLSLEKLLIKIGTKGSTINDRIADLVKRNVLAEHSIKAFDIVRIAGNNAAHPGTINDDDFEEIALTLFSLVNIITRLVISEIGLINNTYDSMPKGAQEAVKKRDRPTQK
ncbi:DUF4145 domain-containing protein [Morganella morganii]|uniref:DUF4145 domain-containing protein n=1 Tax=Morganella morganii TaxID=582 RepID=UPI0021D179C2|nr:DUF4145 domain-containing protein [Morganella morganii]MCU6224152.1 DUF4145 domain-containing protein [Morganella morganii]MCU6234676.1 DUF4145 domain-containing protein [Morganella morganii]